jgi:hypothetical protein
MRASAAGVLDTEQHDWGGAARGSNVRIAGSAPSSVASTHWRLDPDTRSHLFSSTRSDTAA